MQKTSKQRFSFSITESPSQELLLLLNRNFRYQLSIDELSHYCLNGIFGRNRFYLMFNDEGELVGCFGVLPVQAYIKGASNNLGYANYLAIDQEYRGIFSFQALSNFVFKNEMNLGTVALYGPPNQSGYLAHTKLTGWLKFSEVELMARRAPQEFSDTSFNFPPCLKPDIPDKLFQVNMSKYEFTLHRSKDWMQWRYYDFPERNYRVLTSFNNEVIDYFCVLKEWKNKDGKNIMHIMDMFSCSDSSWRLMLEKINQLTGSSCEINMWMSKNSHEYLSLCELGFESIKKQPLIYKPLLNNCFNHLDDKNILFSYGDAEGY
jgi:hypothetical protein